jgi:hypothetical protein
MPSQYHSVEADLSARLLQQAREQGDVTEVALTTRLSELPTTSELRRFDVVTSDLAETATQEARGADVFVAMRLSNDASGPESAEVVEAVLFGAGRHLLLSGDPQPLKGSFERAWWPGTAAVKPVVLSENRCPIFTAPRP